MPLTNSALRYYDHNVLRLPATKRTEYHGQVDRLITELKKRVRDKTEIKITKVVKAGSFAKYTILKKGIDDPVDVDVVFYISDEGLDTKDYATLSQTIFDLLVGIYPNKSVEDFEIQKKAATVQFVASGLAVDIVPVIDDPSRENYGLQYDADGTTTKACAPCQIKFVADRKKLDADYRTLVRMLKRWRNQHGGIKALKSFIIELIIAKVLDDNGKTGTLEERLRDVLRYIWQSELKQDIRFPENTAPFPYFDDAVVIRDPVCSENNVASRISESERKLIVEAAQEAWETLHFASSEDDNDVWKEVFGPRFKTED